MSAAPAPWSRSPAAAPRDIVLVNRTRKTAEVVATDMRYGTPLGPKVDIVDGDYDALAGAGIVLITAGVNEKTGGATNRNDLQGRLKLLDKNAEIYREIVPWIVRAKQGLAAGHQGQYGCHGKNDTTRPARIREDHRVRSVLVLRATMPCP